MKLIHSLLLITLVACGQKNAEKKAGATDTREQSGLPVETEPANSNYKPAFVGQTRIAGVKTKTAITHKIIADKLERPWGIAVMHDGRLLITQKQGTMRIVWPDGKISEPITGLPKVDPKGQGGLLGIALDPDFPQNRMVFWSFSEPSKEGNLTAVAKGKLSSDEKTIENPVVIFRATPVYDGDKHYGSRLVFGRDGFLYVSTGERSDRETRPQAQWLNSGLGKVVRITKDGKPASGNPFIGVGDAIPEIYSYGHRNVQGLAVHPVTGDIWNSEMGPMGGDEINIIRAGKNYGWPEITYGVEYSGDKISNGATQKPAMEQPAYYWDPVLSPSGMTFYSKNDIPEWQNNLFIGGLSSTHICRLVIENNKVVGEERLLDREFQRIRDVAEAKTGGLYAITDDGRLYWIGKK